jgi:hypothetical protein
VQILGRLASAEEARGGRTIVLSPLVGSAKILLAKLANGAVDCIFIQHMRQFYARRPFCLSAIGGCTPL